VQESRAQLKRNYEAFQRVYMPRGQRAELLRAAGSCWQRLGSDAAANVAACAGALADACCARAYAVVAQAMGTAPADPATLQAACTALEKTIAELRKALVAVVPCSAVGFPETVRSAPSRLLCLRHLCSITFKYTRLAN
jgi:hypothetical protein